MAKKKKTEEHSSIALARLASRVLRAPSTASVAEIKKLAGSVLTQYEPPTSLVLPPSEDFSDLKREAVEHALGNLGHTTFAWLAKALARGVWPDGIGGFTTQERYEIALVRDRAAEYFIG